LIGETAFSTRLLDQRPFKSVGVALHTGWWRDLGLGWLIGIAMIILVSVLQLITRQEAFYWDHLDVTGALTAIGQGALLYLTAAFFEELIMRGFPFQALLRDYQTWVAVVIMSLIFAAFHNANPSFSWLAFVNTFIAGIWLSIAYLKTRSLWLATGLHTGWNFAMGVLFKYPVSGTDRPTDALVGVIVRGNHWLTGGDYGPEGGLVATLVIIIGAYWLWRTKLLAVSPEMKKLLEINQSSITLSGQPLKEGEEKA
jgi:membrane protease YdiL (CAAX protease family)